MRNLFFLVIVACVLSACAKDRTIWNTNGKINDSNRSVWDSNGKMDQKDRKIWVNKEGKPVIK